LGFHCSQKDRAGTRASACFSAVAGCQQQILSTVYPQKLARFVMVDIMSVSRTAITPKSRLDGRDSSGDGKQSRPRRGEVKDH
jgi:hypothetical protein